MPIRQSFSWWCYAGRGVADDVLLSRAKAIGYDAVELISADKFARANDCGLAIASHGGHQSISKGLNDLAEHSRIASEIHDSLALAVQYDIPNLIVFSGERRDGLTDEQGIENAAAGLARVAKAAEDAGVTLVLELLNSKIDHKNYQADQTNWGVKVCEIVNSPRVKLLYDIYHMQIMEGDVIRTLTQNAAQIGHYHTAGVPGRHEIDATQELNYPAIVSAIQATGYDGFLGHEFVPTGDVLPALEAAFRLCDF